MLISSKVGLFVTLKGYHVPNMKGRSSLMVRRIVVWITWKKMAVVVIIAVNFWIRGIHAAIVRDPVTGSVVGRSSQMNASVSSNIRTIASLRNLIQSTRYKRINGITIEYLIYSNLRNRKYICDKTESTQQLSKHPAWPAKWHTRTYFISHWKENILEKFYKIFEKYCALYTKNSLNIWNNTIRCGRCTHKLWFPIYYYLKNIWV